MLLYIGKVYPVVSMKGDTTPPVLIGGFPIEARIVRQNRPVFYVECFVGRRRAKQAFEAIGYMVLTDAQERRYLTHTETPHHSPAQSRSQALRAERHWMSR